MTSWMGWHSAKPGGAGTVPLGSLTNPGPTPAQVAGLTTALNTLDDTLDSVADRLTADSIFQLVRGTTTAAAASLDALSSDTRPPEGDIARVPRGGTALFTSCRGGVRRQSGECHWLGAESPTRNARPPKCSSIDGSWSHCSVRARKCPHSTASANSDRRRPRREAGRTHYIGCARTAAAGLPRLAPTGGAETGGVISPRASR